jgi:hypothetical protein
MINRIISLTAIILVLFSACDNKDSRTSFDHLNKTRENYQKYSDYIYSRIHLDYENNKKDKKIDSLHIFAFDLRLKTYNLTSLITNFDSNDTKDLIFDSIYVYRDFIFSHLDLNQDNVIQGFINHQFDYKSIDSAKNLNDTIFTIEILNDIKLVETETLKYLYAKNNAS